MPLPAHAPLSNTHPSGLSKLVGEQFLNQKGREAEGWATALVLSGATSDPSAVPDDLAPDVVLESIADLPDVLGG